MLRSWKRLWILIVWIHIFIGFLLDGIDCLTTVSVTIDFCLFGNFHSRSPSTTSAFGRVCLREKIMDTKRWGVPSLVHEMTVRPFNAVEGVLDAIDNKFNSNRRLQSLWWCCTQFLGLFSYRTTEAIIRYFIGSLARILCSWVPLMFL